MSKFENFILWLYEVERDIKFNIARRRCKFSDCAEAYERYRTKRRMLLKHHKIMF